jgi:hypothetical protein
MGMRLRDLPLAVAGPVLGVVFLASFAVTEGVSTLWRHLAPAGGGSPARLSLTRTPSVGELR